MLKFGQMNAIEAQNAFKVKMNGRLIISPDQRTVDGRFLGRNDMGVFSTLNYGKIVVDLRQPPNCLPGTIVVMGSGLARPIRPGINKDEVQHRSAITGHHVVNVGKKGKGASTIGKDGKTGEINRLEFSFHKPSKA